MRNVPNLMIDFSRELRVVILKIACSVKFDHCLDTATMKLKNFVESNATQKLHPDIRSIVYSFGGLC